MIQSILISRADSIGDVILTLPMAGVLKKYFPNVKIGFIGRAYTKPVIEACIHVNEFIDVEDFYKQDVLVDGKRPDAIIHVFPLRAIAKRAHKLKIPLRIGTTNRLYHWTTCNKLIKLSRKNSPLHESQLNLKLLSAFGIKEEFTLNQVASYYGLTKIATISDNLFQLIDKAKFNLIIHPKSQGSAREWGLDNFITLIKLLDKNKYKIFISGTSKERVLLSPLFEEAGNLVTDITGKMNLNQFISFINNADGLLANSTGPLHIAAALGKHALGLFPPMRPIHPGRWSPVGSHAHTFVLNKQCDDCRNKPEACSCIHSIQAIEIKNKLDDISYSVHQ
ncbi:MAG: glycosyltransferase family 9 protein [Alphaproteobacteria bacterium]